MTRITFQFDPDFDDNIYRASHKSKSSLRPLFDQVRQATDDIYFKAKTAMQSETGRAEGEVEASREDRFKPEGKKKFNTAKARAFAIRSASNSTHPTMEYDGKEIHGRVTINRRGSVALEFGGGDPVAEIGRGTGEHVEHPPYAFLRRAMD